MISARLNYLKISPRKVRLAAALLRGLTAKEAEQQLAYLNKKSARPLLKLLRSAIANAKNNFKLKEDNLYIKELKVNEGPALKRWMPKAFGQATPVRKQSSHLTLILVDKNNPTAGSLKKEKKKKKIKKEKETDAIIVNDLKEIKKSLPSKEINMASDFSDKADDHQPTKKDIKDLSLKNEGKDNTKGSSSKSLKKIFRRKTIG